MHRIQGPGLLDLVLEAHGGIERWSKARTIRARLDMSGPAWTALGQEKIFADLDVAVEVHEQRTVFTGFTGPGLRGVYTPDHVAIEDRHADGRPRPRCPNCSSTPNPVPS